MARRSNSYAQIINDAKVMLAGLTANAERMAKRGITAEFIANLQSVYDEVRTIDNEQEALKARQKEKSDLLNKRLSVLQGFISEARKAVKLEMPQESWKEFGINDKR